MAKYRILGTDELEALQEDFIQFLILNGITGEDWESLKAKQPESANQIVESFSDVVFETILRKQEYIKIQTATELLAFRFLPSQAIMFGAKAKRTSLDLSDQNSFTIVTSTKKYDGTREEALWQLVLQGGEFTDGTLFNQLCAILPT